MSFSKTAIYIVDDDPAIRDSLMLMLGQEHFTVNAYESAETFLTACKSDSCGCAIIDIRMLGMDGMQLQETLSIHNIPLAVIFLTGHGDIPMSVKAMKAGAIDFLTKPVTREKLLSAIKAATLESEKKLIEKVHLEEAQSHIAVLTDRERDVMALALKGFPNKKIARLLGISHRTVEIHKSKIMHKTGAENLLDLARIVHKSDIY